MSVSTSIVPTASASSVEVNSGGNPAVVAAAPSAALREVRGVISGVRLADGHWTNGYDVTVSDQSGSVTVHVPCGVYAQRRRHGLRTGAALSVLGRVDQDRVLAVVMTGLVPPAQVADHLAARDGSDPLARLGW